MASFTLTARAPYRHDLTVWALRRLAINEMDRWDGRIWRRVLVVRDRPVEVAVAQAGTRTRPRVEVSAVGRLGTREREAVGALVTRMLGLDLDISAFYALARRPPFAAVVEPLVGLRPPRMPAVFEALVNGIACQQLSLTVGIHLLNRTTRLTGLPIVGRSPTSPERKARGSAGEGTGGTVPAVHHAFPRPGDMARVSVADLRGLGFSVRKAETILGIAAAAASGSLDLEGLANLPDVDALARLRAIRGVGRWTAEYVLLRGLRRLDHFPADDVGGQKRLQELFGLPERPGYDECQELLAPLRPYRGLLYFHLLVSERVRQGLVAATP